MPLEMKLELAPQVGMRQMLENRMGKAYEVIDYWESQPKLEVTLQLGGQAHKVKYVLAPPSWLNYLAKGEKFGAYIGDMVFINSKLSEESPNCVPYVLLKLYGERFVNQGVDKSGKVKHWQSLWGTIRVAGQIMNPDQMYSFLKELEAHESSGFFELDGQVREFMEKHDGSLIEGKRKYLETHHQNRWIVRGRNEESLASLGMSNQGFRNHAEAIMSSIKDFDLQNLYLVAGFVHTLAACEANTPIQVGKPYNSFAYAMTRGGNGLTDLVRFLEPTEGGDVIIKLPRRMPTWTALSKRLSYTMHQTEKQVGELAEKERKRLDGIIIEAGQKTNHFEKEVETVRALITAGNRFEEAIKMLQTLPIYQKEVARLEELSASAAKRMYQLAELSQLLVQQI